MNLIQPGFAERRFTGMDDVTYVLDDLNSSVGLEAFSNHEVLEMLDTLHEAGYEWSCDGDTQQFTIIDL